MPTLNPSRAIHNALIIHGLDANPVYLPLYVEAKNRGKFIQSTEFRSLAAFEPVLGAIFFTHQPGFCLLVTQFKPMSTLPTRGGSAYLRG
jgi:hypothetical protein